MEKNGRYKPPPWTNDKIEVTYKFVAAGLISLLVFAFGQWASTVKSGTDSIVIELQRIRQQQETNNAALRKELRELQIQVSRMQLRMSERQRALEIDVNNLREEHGLHPREHDLPQ